MKNWLDLQNYLSDNDSSDIVAFDLYEELLVLRNTIEKEVLKNVYQQALTFLKKNTQYFF